MKNRPAFYHRFSQLLAFALLFATLQGHAQALSVDVTPPPEPDELWLLLNQDEQRLQVMLGDYPVVYYQNVAWGRGGVGVKQRQGDQVTPVGDFRIRWINRNSKYRVFLGFDYPNRSYADLGLRSGTLTPYEHKQIINAWSLDKVPPQSTALGGSLGIHGLGNADADIHNRLNWTSGCVALNNVQIDHLMELVSIGTRVIIQ